MDRDIQILCDFLERLLNGSIAAEDARNMIPSLEALSQPDLKELYGNLFHYIDDADIRSKDAGYKELQDSEMKKLIHRLKQGDFAKANAVTFLRRT